MDILYLSPCVPNPPDKGERIRAFHEVRHLSARHRVHLACFARDRDEATAAPELAGACASLYVDRLHFPSALAAAALRFALGDCLTVSFYRSRRLSRYVRDLARRAPLSATIAYSSVMAPFAPAGVPLLLDMVDVDSEKWLQYAHVRRPGPIYALEGRRLRALEVRFAARAGYTLLATHQEATLLGRIAPGAPSGHIENGVDFEYFDPHCSPRLPDLEKRRFLLFLGAMDYYPNQEAACRFAIEIFPQLRRHEPDLEFFIVGRNPGRAVRRLAERAGVTVTGSVLDVRPYLAASGVVVAPLRIARGIQNKVLEALSMGKRILASSAVCATFGSPVPPGVVPCHTTEEFLDALRQPASPPPDQIRQAARRRFSWNVKMELLAERLHCLAGI